MRQGSSEAPLQVEAPAGAAFRQYGQEALGQVLDVLEEDEVVERVVFDVIVEAGGQQGESVGALSALRAPFGSPQ
jgi:hypothetical protein